jgi:hypothetical protein
VDPIMVEEEVWVEEEVAVEDHLPLMEEVTEEVTEEATEEPTLMALLDLLLLALACPSPKSLRQSAPLPFMDLLLYQAQVTAVD